MQFEDAVPETTKQQADDEPIVDLGGRPQSLIADDATLKQISTLARMQCTQKEAAAVLGVHQETLRRFFAREEKAKTAWQDGIETGKVSLRRNQYKMSENNPTMAIWLGKQWLDQTDKNTFEGGKVPISIEVKWAE